MKIDFIADTNFLIYVLEGNEIVEGFLSYNFSISFITEVELLGYDKLSLSEETKIKSIIKDCFIIEWNNKIKEQTILLRKNYKIKLPDAIVASASIVYGLPLITADKSFSKIKELDLILLDF